MLLSFVLSFRIFILSIIVLPKGLGNIKLQFAESHL